MKRFYKNVTTGPHINEGFLILLDEKPIRTPAKELLVSPTQSLADIIAKEWDAQDELIKPETMPVTQILTTAIDRVQTYHTEMLDNIEAYLDSDLLCYHAKTPQNVHDEQVRLWQPWLDWFAEKFSHTLETTTDLVRLDQDAQAHTTIRQHLNTLDLHHFTVLQTVTSMSGSIVLSLAFLEHAITPDALYECALCEELFQERIHDLEKHGLDPIEERRRKTLMIDLNACKTYLDNI